MKINTRGNRKVRFVRGVRVFFQRGFSRYADHVFVWWRCTYAPGGKAHSLGYEKVLATVVSFYLFFSTPENLFFLYLIVAPRVLARLLFFPLVRGMKKKCITRAGWAREILFHFFEWINRLFDSKECIFCCLIKNFLNF